jgi:sterol desaturase/sphingolipid hydroxylase (fatty acid hydroxylase superfamily)
MNPETLTAWPVTAVAVGGVAYFAAIYVVAGAIASAVRAVLLKRGRGRLLDPRRVPEGQVAREWRLSALSVLIFGAGLVVPWAMVVAGWAQLHPANPPLRVVCELLALLVWNDIHFYAVHRTLHQPHLLRAVHAVHHQSIVTTPWSTYAFHPVEALLLGSVLLPPMAVWNFTPLALALLPILSLTYNVIGHSNLSALPRRWRWLSNSQDHHLHHACHRGNYGFLFTFMDRGFGTQLPHDATRAVIEAGLAREARQAEAAR